MLYIKLFIEREKNIGQSALECPFNKKLSTLQILMFNICCYLFVMILARIKQFVVDLCSRL